MKQPTIELNGDFIHLNIIFEKLKITSYFFALISKYVSNTITWILTSFLGIWPWTISYNLDEWSSKEKLNLLEDVVKAFILIGYPIHVWSEVQKQS